MKPKTFVGRINEAVGVFKGFQKGLIELPLGPKVAKVIAGGLDGRGGGGPFYFEPL